MTGRQPYAVTVPKGYRVDRWEVREPLATGAFQRVRGAQHRTGQRAGAPPRAALKFLPTGTRTPRRLRRLRELAAREVDLLRRLRAPRLIRMYEALTVDDPQHPELDGATVLVLEQAAGSLDGLLTRGAPPEHGPALLVQICEGLHQPHRAGWVHGDLTPRGRRPRRGAPCRPGGERHHAPSLGLELPSHAGSYTPPLVALGNCNLATARSLAAALRKAADG